LIHVVLNSETDPDVRNKLSYSLHMANEHVKTIALPFPGIRMFETTNTYATLKSNKRVKALGRCL